MQRCETTIPEVVVAVNQALHGAVLDRWRRLVDEAVAVRPARLVIDLADCPRIDAAAIVMLLQVHRQMLCADAQLILRCPTPRVRRMLELAHIDRVFDIETAGQQLPQEVLLR